MQQFKHKYIKNEDTWLKVFCLTATDMKLALEWNFNSE